MFNLKLETTLDFFIFFIIVIKIVFVITALGHLYLTHSNNQNASIIDPLLVYWKQRTEFIFTICMAILLIYHFRPASQKPIGKETKTLFFLFGIILIFTADWNLFVHESPWYKTIVNTLN